MTTEEPKIIHKLDVAAVLAALVEANRKALMVEHHHEWTMENISEAAHICARATLAALTAAGIRCLYVPDEKIKHGARLRRAGGDWAEFYGIEATP